MLNPLSLPRRVAEDVDAISEAARGLPGFERELITQVNGLRGEVRSMGSELNASIDGLRGEVRSMGAELNASIERLNTKVAELRTEVSEAVELLPDPDEPGPIARARDAIVGNDPAGDR